MYIVLRFDEFNTGTGLIPSSVAAQAGADLIKKGYSLELNNAKQTLTVHAGSLTGMTLLLETLKHEKYLI